MSSVQSQHISLQRLSKRFYVMCLLFVINGVLLFWGRHFWSEANDLHWSSIVLICLCMLLCTRVWQILRLCKPRTRLKSTLIHTAFVQAYRCLVCSIFLLFKRTVCSLTGETLKHWLLLLKRLRLGSQYFVQLLLSRFWKSEKTV